MDKSRMVGLPGVILNDELKAIPFSIKNSFPFEHYFYSLQADRQKRLLSRIYHFKKGFITSTTCKLIAGRKLKFSFKFVLFQ